MGSSASPFLPSAGGDHHHHHHHHNQIGTFPTFPGPFFGAADDDALAAAVGAFPPLAAFGFGTFCPDDQQQQLFLPIEQQQQQQQQHHHQFLPPAAHQSQFLGADVPPLSCFVGVDETQQMLMMNMAATAANCGGGGGGTFLTVSSADQQQQQLHHEQQQQSSSNFLLSAHSTNDGEAFIAPTTLIGRQDLSSTLFVSPTNCAIGDQSPPPAVQLEELSKNVLKNDGDNKTFVQQQPLLSARRGNAPTQRGTTTRRKAAAERVGKRKAAQNANNSSAIMAQLKTPPVKVPPFCDENEEEAKDDMKAQLLLINQQQLTPTTATAGISGGEPMELRHQSSSSTVSPRPTAAAHYSMAGTTIVAPEGLLPKRCAHCDGDIHDRIMLVVSSSIKPKFFHCACLKCCECGILLEQVPRCFVRSESVYCAGCYAKNFDMCCVMCERRIGPCDWVRRAREFVYHLACFKCEHCKHHLTTGDRFSLDDLHRPPPGIPRVLCHTHYKELVLGDQCSPKQKTKRVRTTFGEEQLSILQEYFQVDSNPDGADLEKIANQTGLSKRVTQVWFQNSRARQKKYHGHVSCRKSVILPGGGGSTSASSGASGMGVDMASCLGGCRSATLTPSTSSSNGARTDGQQSPILFSRGASMSSESDGFRQLLTGSGPMPPSSPSAISGDLSSADAPSAELLQKAKKSVQISK